MIVKINIQNDLTDVNIKMDIFQKDRQTALPAERKESLQTGQVICHMPAAVLKY